MGTKSAEVKKTYVSNMTPKKDQTARCSDAGIYAQRVEKKAYELFQKRGCADGHDREDWFAAEKIVEEEMITGD